MYPCADYDPSAKCAQPSPPIEELERHVLPATSPFLSPKHATKLKSNREMVSMTGDGRPVVVLQCGTAESRTRGVKKS
jgi:hypothetical protein